MILCTIQVPRHTITLVAFPSFDEWEKGREVRAWNYNNTSLAKQELYNKKLTAHYRRCGQAVRAFMKQENPKRQRRMKVCQIKNRNY